jgi:hypothetical protein
MQYGDPATGRFFMRVQFTVPADGAGVVPVTAQTRAWQDAEILTLVGSRGLGGLVNFGGRSARCS